MALIWITGTPGTGKTSTARALRVKGFEAYDADLDGFRVWRRRDTNEEVTFPGWLVLVGWHEGHYMPIVRSRDASQPLDTVVEDVLKIAAGHIKGGKG